MASNLDPKGKLCLKCTMIKRLPSLESLRVLEACVRHASFSRAAEELAVTPAAVSLRIRNLEAQLRTILFKRSGPKLESTTTARRLADRLAEALQQMQNAVEDCQTHVAPLRVTAPPSFAARWLAPSLRRYHALADAPATQIDVSMELRAAQQFDVAIRTGLGDWAGFEVTPLAPLDATPMLSPALAATCQLTSPADIARLPLLPNPDWPRWFREAGVQPRRLRLCPDDFPTHELDAAAAVEGAGVALLPPLLFSTHLQQGSLVQPFAHLIRGPTWHCLLIRSSGAHPAAAGFRAWLQRELQRDRLTVD